MSARDDAIRIGGERVLAVYGSGFRPFGVAGAVVDAVLAAPGLLAALARESVEPDKGDLVTALGDSREPALDVNSVPGDASRREAWPPDDLAGQAAERLAVDLTLQLTPQLGQQTVRLDHHKAAHVVLAVVAARRIRELTTAAGGRVE